MLTTTGSRKLNYPPRCLYRETRVTNESNKFLSLLINKSRVYTYRYDVKHRSVTKSRESALERKLLLMTRLCLYIIIYRARQKSGSLKNFANFSTPIKRYDKIYTLVAHSTTRKSGKFRYLISRIGKITVLLVMEA